MDEMIKKVVANEFIKKPSLDFTDKVMNKIFELKVTVQPKPLISKVVWYVLGIMLLIFTVAVSIISPQTASNNEPVAIQKVESFFSSLHFPSFHLSLNINLYVIVGACIALLLLTLFDVVLFRKK